ncbi:MAG: hypothetical protein ACUVWX_14795 [Kiritimatiellia bacterium]
MSVPAAVKLNVRWCGQREQTTPRVDYPFLVLWSVRCRRLQRRQALGNLVALSVHLQEQALVQLREGKDVRRVHRLGTDLVDLVRQVQQVALGIKARAFDVGKNLADDLLPRCGVCGSSLV